MFQTYKIEETYIVKNSVSIIEICQIVTFHDILNF
jgi:hypothetical protein